AKLRRMSEALERDVPQDDAPTTQRLAALTRLRAQLVVLRAAPVGEEVHAPVAAPHARSLALDASVQFVKGVGPRLGELLAQRGLRTAGDLLYFLPRRYEQRVAGGRIADLREDTRAIVEGEVLARATRRQRGRQTLEVALGDASGTLHLKWVHVPGASFADRFERGRRLRASGLVKRYRGVLQMVHPETQLVTDDEAAVPVDDAVVPVYAEIEGLRPPQLRRVVRELLDTVQLPDDALPDALRTKHQLPVLAQSLIALHAPPLDTSVEALDGMATPWHRRLIYEELLLLQLAVLRRKALYAAEPGRAIELAVPLSQVAAQLFAFPLTAAQARVLADIERDLGRALPMQRLLQGDVGSGKTAVALAAAAAVAKAGYQVAIMAPTEVLAEQHARLALTTLPRAGVRVALLTSGLSAPERREALAQIAAGEVQVVVGTHAVIQADVTFRALALAVVDEQHRFGVLQRARLLEQGRAGLGCAPHMLVMTATPIPRTLALTVYGDLDISLIDEMPPGRTPVVTRVYREKQRDQAYRRLRDLIASGRQAFVVFPLIEGSDKEGMDGILDATTARDELATGPLQDYRLGLLHGRMSGDEKDRVMRAFLRHEIDVLIATTVIEVGIDVANASVMLIEHAERFGLSQLHQLRGRVGRGAHRSECLLVAHHTGSEDAWRRLRVMERTYDGFVIAEEDLAIRGPGDFIGTRQSGTPFLSLADLARDRKLLELARRDAEDLLTRDPQLAAPEHRALAGLIQGRWHERLELVQVG
ncbi:MAG: ATP-dependent DNA helicase RecG, partial [Myxococcota bacterium]